MTPDLRALYWQATKDTAFRLLFGILFMALGFFFCLGIMPWGGQ